MIDSKRTILQTYVPQPAAYAVPPSLLSDIVHRIGHEVGNPLTSIISLASIIERFNAPDTEQGSNNAQFAGSILKESWKIGHISEKLVLLLSLREPSIETVSPRELVEKILSRLRTRGTDGLDDLILRIEEDDQRSCDADPELLSAALSELLRNACAALSRAGDDSLLGPVLRVKNVNSQCTLEVINELSESETLQPLESLFPPLQRSSEYAPGVGIGLPVVARIAERLGAAFELSEWHNDNGQRFFSARLDLGPQNDGKNEDLEPDESARPNKSTRTVLVIDDQPPIASAIRKIISISQSQLGEVDCLCCSGAEAIAILHSNTALHAVICDIQLSDMQGSAILNWISKNRPALVPRFAFMTGGTVAPELQNMPCLQKPFEPEELLTLITSLFSGTPKQ